MATEYDSRYTIASAVHVEIVRNVAMPAIDFKWSECGAGYLFSILYLLIPLMLWNEFRFVLMLTTNPIKAASGEFTLNMPKAS